MGVFYNVWCAVKSKLKKISFIWIVNARIKEYILHYQYNKLYKSNTSEVIQQGNVYNFGEKNYIDKREKILVIWVGACYEQDYSGFRQSLSKYAEVIDFTRTDGTYGLEPPKIRKGLIYDEERKRNGQRLLEIYRNAGAEEKVTLVIGQMWSTLMDPDALLSIKKRGTRVVNIAMDDKLPVHWKSDNKGRLSGAIGLANSVDLTLNTCKQAVSMYQSKGFPCMYWPLASSGEMFKPSEDKSFDVVFVGSNYGYRSHIIKALLEAGINVKAFGPGFESGMLSAVDMSEVFGKAKIILGMGFISYSRKISTLKLRDFDAMFTGALYITSRNEDLEEIFTDKENIVYYDSIEHLIFLIKYYLAHEDERHAIVHNALLNANEFHRWDVRIEDTLKLLGFEIEK